MNKNNNTKICEVNISMFRNARAFSASQGMVTVLKKIFKLITRFPESTYMSLLFHTEKIFQPF